AKRMFLWNAAFLKKLGRSTCWRRHQFKHHSIWIKKADDFLPKSRRWALSTHLMRFQTLNPIADRLRGNGKCCRLYLACPTRAAPRARPWEKGEDGARRSTPVREIKVISARIIEIDRALH